MDEEIVFVDGVKFHANQLLEDRSGRVFRLLSKAEQNELETSKGYYQVGARVVDAVTGRVWEFGRASGITNTTTLHPIPYQNNTQGVTYGQSS